MKKAIIMAGLVTAPFLMQAQLSGALKRLKNTAGSTAENRADNTVSDGVNKTIDNLFRKKKKKAEAGQEPEAPTANPPNQPAGSLPKKQPALKSYSRFDFVPGEKIMYAEDFSKDAVGEMPLLWTTKGKGEVMELDGIPGKWLRGFKQSALTSVNKNELGDNYTIEFDLVYFFGPKEAVYVMPDLKVRVLNNYTVDYANASGNVSERTSEQSFSFNIHPKDKSLAWVETYGGPATFKSDNMELPDFSSNYNKVQHYAIQVQKNRLRIWIDQNKVVDLPQAVNTSKKMARISFELGHTSFPEHEVGYYVSNIRFANGAPDTRHKLLEEGKFSTTGILFALNSAEIQPPSYGVLKEIAAVLKENPDLKIKIAGHTSSDGKQENNLTLSQKRAESVKQSLIKDFSISEDRLQTEGKGDKEPLASNTTLEGRLQNRRVEFIKL